MPEEKKIRIAVKPPGDEPPQEAPPAPAHDEGAVQSNGDDPPSSQFDEQPLPKGDAPAAKQHAARQVSPSAATQSDDIPAKRRTGVHPLSHAGTDPYADRRRVIRVGFGLTLLLSLVGIAAWDYNQEWTLASKGFAYLENLHYFGQNDVKRISKVAKSPNGQIRWNEESLRSKTCMELAVGLAVVDPTKTKAFRLDEAVAQAECHYMSGKLLEALSDLRPVSSQLLRADEAKLNDPRSDLGYGFILLLELMLDLGRDDDRINMFAERGCSQWVPTPTCLGRLIVMTQRGHNSLVATGYSRLLPQVALFPPALQSTLHKFHARWARANGQKELASQSYTRAIQTAPKVRPVQLLNLWVENLLYQYRLGAFDGITALARDAERALTTVDRQDKWKIRLLGDLADPKLAAKAMADFFQKESTAYLARGDREFVAGIGLLAIQHGLAEKYLRLLKNASMYATGSLKSSQMSLKRLDSWEIRTLLALDRYEGAIKASVAFQKRYGDDFRSRHLRAVGILGLSEHPQYQKQAADLFRQAADERPNWESIYGLGIAQIRAGFPNGTSPILERYLALPQNPKLTYWGQLFQAEFLIATGKPGKAIPLLLQAQQSMPQSFQTLILLSEAYAAQGKKSDANRIKQQLDDLRRSVSYLRTPEGVSSPIGPLALLE